MLLLALLQFVAAAATERLSLAQYSSEGGGGTSQQLHLQHSKIQMLQWSEYSCACAACSRIDSRDQPFKWFTWVIRALHVSGRTGDPRPPCRVTDLQQV
jgi:hypothetical protein